MARPGFWEDPKEAQKVTQAGNSIKNRIDNWTKLQKVYEEAEVLYELGQEEEEYLKEAADTLDRLGKELDETELSLLFRDKYDSSNAILSLHPGAGGTESQDWAEMLLRMYSRWAEKRGFAVEMLRDPSGQGRECLWLPESGKRGAPPGAHFAVRRFRQEAHLFCRSRCPARSKR